MLDGAERVVREVGGIGDEFAVLFVTAGAATHHFAMVPQNLRAATRRRTTTPCCVERARWRRRSAGGVHVASSAAPDFTTTPRVQSYSRAPVYVHYTSNETIYGTWWEFHRMWMRRMPLVGMTCVERHLQPAARARRPRPDLRRRAEEPRPFGDQPRDREARLSRDRARRICRRSRSTARTPPRSRCTTRRTRSVP